MEQQLGLKSHHLDSDGLATAVELASIVTSTIILSGKRQHDRFIINNTDGTSKIGTLESLCHQATGSLATWQFDPHKSALTLIKKEPNCADTASLPSDIGREKKMSLGEALVAFAAIPAAPGSKLVMIVDAALLLEDPGAPRAEDFLTLRALEHCSRHLDKTKLFIYRASKTADCPAVLLNSPKTKSIHIPPASRDDRYSYAKLRGTAIAVRCQSTIDELAKVVAAATDDLTLDEIEAYLQTADKQGLSRLVDVDELARAISLGSTKSPWSGNQITEAVKSAQPTLEKSVQGQPAAIEAVTTSLRKSVVGLSAAHQGRSAQTPRAVFFFAGPTGTGKTESAKAISNLIYGAEKLIRFDCGELRQEHAVSKLIGAPPGYVGYDKGGELTEAIRQNPNSVVLFDEIEKAHPKLFDTLLAVLDDGRLTSGQGETAYFGQSVLIFTSNLGMYEEIDNSFGAVTRQARFTYDTPFEQIQREVREAIRHEFTSKLGRPELLGRFGGAENIIVFDYLRDLNGVTRKFTNNVIEKVARLHGITLSVSDEVVELIVSNTKTRPDALVLGGRGLAFELERVLTNPLSDYLFQVSPKPKQLQAQLSGNQVEFINL